jgi:hypothetical protein
MMRAVLISAGSLFVISWLLLIGELWAREVYVNERPAPARPDSVALPPELLQADPQLGVSFRPNSDKFFASRHGEFAVHYQINEIGLREAGTIFLGERPPYALILGDSVVEGWGVMGETTFIEELQRRLRRFDDIEPYSRLFNAGMSGYGAAQSNLLARRLLNTLGADLVVLVYTGLMPVADYHFLANATLDKNGIAVNSGTHRYRDPQPSNLLGSVLNSSTMVEAVKSSFDAWRARSALVPGDPNSDLFAATRSEASDTKNLHQASLAHVAALAKFAEANGAQFLLVHVPMPHQVSNDEWEEGRKVYQFDTQQYPSPDADIVREFCAANKIHCVMTTEMFRELAKVSSSRVFFRHDYTLTPVGHRALVMHLLDTFRAALSLDRLSPGWSAEDLQRGPYVGYPSLRAQGEGGLDDSTQ